MKKILNLICFRMGPLVQIDESKSRSKMRYLVQTIFWLGFLGSQVAQSTMQGNLVVRSGALRVQREDGFKVRFYSGTYRSEVDFGSGILNLTVYRKDVRTDIPIRLPIGNGLPENGEFDWSPEQLRQTFSLKGTVSTTRSQTSTIHDIESCVYYRREWVCEGHGHHGGRCHWEEVPVQGTRDVEYYFLTTSVQLSCILRSSADGQGELTTQSVNREKIYTFRGECY